MTSRPGVLVAVAVVLMATLLGAISGPAAEASSGGQSPIASLNANLARKVQESSKQLTFAGYQWTVKTSTAPIGPGPNLFDANGPYVDSSGALHLRITKTTAGWECSEVILNQFLGYGTYRWTVDGPVASLDPNVVMGLFTYDESGNTPGNGELDFEASRFANPGIKTDAQYVVQPNKIKGNRYRITLSNPKVTRVVMTWLPGKVTFSADSLPPWTNTSSSVPTNTTEQVHMNLWLFKGAAPSNGKPVWVKVTAFHFSPAPSTPRSRRTA